MKKIRKKYERDFSVLRCKVASAQIVLAVKITLTSHKDKKQANTEMDKKYYTFSLAVTVQSESRAVFGGQYQK